MCGGETIYLMHLNKKIKFIPNFYLKVFINLKKLFLMQDGSHAREPTLMRGRLVKSAYIFYVGGLTWSTFCGPNAGWPSPHCHPLL